MTPTGEIAVVGISANKTVRDWIWSAMCVPAARIGSWLHSETRNVGVVVKDPQEGLDDIRRTVDEVLPEALVRRALYYRYLPFAARVQQIIDSGELGTLQRVEAANCFWLP